MRLLNKKTKVSKEKSKEQEVEPLLSEKLDQEEFDSFFSEVLKKIPQKTSKVILNTYEKSKKVAETILEKNQVKFDHVYEDFLKGVDPITRKKSHRIIHPASLTAAIIGC